MRKFVFLGVFLALSALDVCEARPVVALASRGKNDNQTQDRARPGLRSVGAAAALASRGKNQDQQPSGGSGQQQPQQGQAGQTADNSSRRTGGAGAGPVKQSPAELLMNAIQTYPQAWKCNAFVNRWTQCGPVLNLCPRVFAISG
jgi:hypothetical protein